MERMRQAQESGDEAAAQEGQQIARETREAIKGFVQGVQISAPLGRVDAALAVLH